MIIEMNICLKYMFILKLNSIFEIYSNMLN